MLQPQTVAVYRYTLSGKRVALNVNTFGMLYQEYLDYPRGSVTNFGPLALDLLKEAADRIAWLQTPPTVYHTWHICTCPECCPLVVGSIWQEHSGGKVWTHSQADWNSHLKYVDQKYIGTFPTVENRGGVFAGLYRGANDE